MTDLDARLPGLLDHLRAEHHVPGAQLAVLTPNGTFSSASGVLSSRTGVETTTDAVFQMGSITKVMTATLVMQLVGEGSIDLDRPVQDYLPDFRVADPALSAAVTARHLLSHSSGIDGDFFRDTGRGDDAVARYVEAMADLGAVAPLGEAFSYSNSAFTLLGHLVAVLSRKPWEAVVQERLFLPLGMATAGTLPEHALLHRAAVGHVVDGESVRPVTVWGITRSAGPAGLVHCSAEDLLRFAALHIREGLAPEGARVLSSESAAAMRLPTTATRDGRSFGLGWLLDDWGQPVLGHDGGTIGQLAFLRVLPEVGAAIALLTNGPGGTTLFSALVSELAQDLPGVTVPVRDPIPQPGLPAGAERWVGAYASVGARYSVELSDGVMWLTSTALLPDAITQGVPPARQELVHIGDERYATRADPRGPWVPVHFLTFSDGSSAIAVGSRITPRTT